MDINKKRILAYIHIPKAAGSTITHILRSRFGLRHCRSYSTAQFYTKADLKIDKKIYPGLRAISGHQLRPFVDFGTYEEDLFWFVMLREPYERFVSQYHWWCQMNKSNMSFEDWCQEKGDKFSNFQVKWLAGEADVKKAIEILDKKIDCAGSQAFFNDSLKMLRSMSGNSKVPTHIVKKINTARKSRKPLNIELCSKYNQLDKELYDFFIQSKWESQKQFLIDSEQKDEFKDTLIEGIRRNINLAYHKGIYCNLKKILN